MAKKPNTIIIIIVVIGAIWAVTQFNPLQSIGPNPSTTPEICTWLYSDLVDNENACIMPCVGVDINLRECLDACGTLDDAQEGNYIYFTDVTRTCRFMYENTARTDCEMDCMYDGYNFIDECTSTDGKNEFVKGRTTNYYGTIADDRCFTGDILHEFYCQNDKPKLEQINCAEGCSDGACLGGSCNTDADTNCDGTVSRTELGTAIQQWLSSTISRTELGQAIAAWVGG